MGLNLYKCEMACPRLESTYYVRAGSFSEAAKKASDKDWMQGEDGNPAECDVKRVTLIGDADGCLIAD